ncbi:endonuclease/exonuclease/phosphatase family protein [Streptomyces sp. NBC_01508]|uniref:endonuclease/exonuclease/phosphatase family protein n=1 Tax=Streptomyces sp. NBC_01508 TaxID=2903888 RepID=UPI003870B7EF
MTAVTDDPTAGQDASDASAAARGAPPPAGRWPLRTRALVAATALWALFTVLGYALSGRWWLWLLPDLAPPPFFLLVPAVLLPLTWWAVPVRRWLTAALVLLLVLGAPRAGVNWSALTPGGGPVSARGDTLKVFSWNTLYWDSSDDPGEFYRYLKAKDADVYLLQEYLAWEDDGPQEIDELARIRAEFPGYEVEVLGELVTLSRFPVVATPPVGPSRAPGSGGPWREVFARDKVLRTDVDVRGRVVSFYNAHVPVQLDIERSPLSGGFYRTVRERDAQRRAHFAALEKDAAANTHPVLISGDFNTTPSMRDIGGLRDTFRDALPASGDLLPGTWNTAGLGLWRLDWTFTDDGLRVHRYAFTDPAGLSDHRGQDLLVSLAP